VFTFPAAFNQADQYSAAVEPGPEEPEKTTVVPTETFDAGSKPLIALAKSVPQHSVAKSKTNKTFETRFIFPPFVRF
jgi:hypothetical protein